jgi:hypothetical protein
MRAISSCSLSHSRISGLGIAAGLVGVAAVEELLLDRAELGGGQHQDTARS